MNKLERNVAFTGRMRYLPTGTWPAPHETRLVWVIQALNDFPCDAKAADAAAVGCSSVNYIHNVPQVVQTYDDAWTLTGINVSEEQGQQTAIIYEDPAVDPNLNDDSSLWMLANGLDNAFLTGRDQDGNGQRDITIREIARRFDYTANAGIPAEQRWGIVDQQNILAVQTRSYSFLDQSVISTTAELNTLLDKRFTPRWNADQSIKPLLLVASERSNRALGLDRSLVGDGAVAVSDTGVTFDMQSSGTGR